MKTYQIRWEPTTNGRSGTGNLQFKKAEAERRAKELNDEYPGLKHKVVLAPQSADPKPARRQSTKRCEPVTIILPRQ